LYQKQINPHYQNIMRFKKQLHVWLLSALAAGFFGHNTNAATLTVTNLADSGPGTLRNQITAAAPGDTILVVVPGNIVLNSQLTISTNLLVYGYSGSPPTKISGNNSHRVFNITGGNDVELHNLGITDGRVVGTNGASGFNGQNVYGGGVLVASGANVGVAYCLVSNNVVVGGQPGAGASGGNGFGGGIAVLGTGTIDLNNSLVVSNASSGGSGGASNGGGQAWGGAIYMEGSIYIGDTTIDANVATGGPGGGGLGTGAGGAIYNVGVVTITASTIVSNSAAGPGDNYGGAIQDYGTTTIHDSTIVGNLATYGGGITGGTLYNTILAGNSASVSGPDGSGTIVSGDYNLIQNTSGISFSGTTTHNITGKNPLLGPLQYNGGLPAPFNVPNLAPLPGSPVIDQGYSSYTYDQRNFPRVYDTALPNAADGNGADIGAIEINPINVLVLNKNDSGSGSLRQAILDNNGLGGGNTITFSNTVAGTITLSNGELAVSAPVTVLGPGAGLVAISANHNGRVFDILGGPVGISGLTLRDGLTVGTPGASGQIGSDGRGGGIFNQNTLTLSNCLVLSNSVIGGSGGTATSGSAGNGGKGLGGGIYNAAGNLIINQCSFNGNSSLGGTGGNATSGYAGYAGNGLGGAICTIAGTNMLTACSLINGLAMGGQGGVATGGGSPGIGGQGYGGGLYSESTVNFVNSTVSGNNATAGNGSGGPGSGIGGGAYNVSDMNFTNCTIANNNANGSSNDSGGGLYNEGTLQVMSCTIAGNQADYGGGIDGNLTAGNTILAGNTATTLGPDGSGTINSYDYNLIQTLSGLSIIGTTTHVIVGQNPLLWPLANNGGPTFTMALLSGSPSIDQGKSFGTATDQRGVARPYDLPSIANAGGGDGSDIGAFEFLPTPKLNIQAANGGNVVLYWTTDAASYRLLATANLSPTINWSNITNSRVTIGNQVYITNSVAGGSQFYQLTFP
jgi:hypothetical protein